MKEGKENTEQKGWIVGVQAPRQRFLRVLRSFASSGKLRRQEGSGISLPKLSARPVLAGADDAHVFRRASCRAPIWLACDKVQALAFFALATRRRRWRRAVTRLVRRRRRAFPRHRLPARGISSRRRCLPQFPPPPPALAFFLPPGRLAWCAAVSLLLCCRCHGLIVYISPRLRYKVAKRERGSLGGLYVCTNGERSYIVVYADRSPPLLRRISRRSCLVGRRRFRSSKA